MMPTQHMQALSTLANVAARLLFQRSKTIQPMRTADCRGAVIRSLHVPLLISRKRHVRNQA
jgi:hypothetical protein